MALPFLPGNSFRSTLGKQKFHLSHHFDYANDVAMNVGEAKPGIGGDPRPDQKYPARFSSIPRGHGTDLPAWVAFDRQVLAYDAYFQEAVHEKREEQYRVRRVKIYFYLEDDSIQVIEPRLKNTGVPQGTLIRRHRVLKPAPLDDLYYTVEDFNIGNEISMYGRVFKIVDCDEFTKNFQRKLGFQERTRLQIPGDPYLEHRKALDEMMQPLRPYERHDTLKQFLDHDRHVLRFFAFWDDTDQMFGDPREMVLHYFLADDTIEIRERIAVNAGRDAVPMFLHRSKLPKGIDPLPKPGEETPRTVLNVFGPMGHGGRYILDSLKTGARDQEFYKDSDLSIGAVLNVWGRKFLLCDCDDFTKEYYMTKYGITDFSPIAYRAPDQARAPKEVPPYNGFGSEEDSLCSTKGLLPKPPKMDFIKFMEKDRHGLDSNVLRFLAVMDTMKPIDKDRQFIVSFFLSDDTLQVFEPIVRNSGIIGGRFLERGRVKRPNQPRFSTQLSQYYQAQDLYVGARLNFNGHKFILVDGDEYAFNYMERHANEYPIANIQVIMERLQRLTEGKMDEFMKPDTAPTTDYQGLHALLMEMTSGQMSDHEVATVARNYQHRGDETVTFENLVSVAQEQLRKVNYEDFVKIVNQCLHYDRERKGVLSPEDVRAVFVSLHIPVNGDLLRAILAKAPVEEGMLRYREFVAVFNWRDNPAPPPPPQVSSRPDEAWMGTTPNRQIGVVDLQRFLKDVFGQ